MPPVAIAIGAAVVGAVVAVKAMRAKLKTPKAEDVDRGYELSRKLDSNYPREIAVGKFATGGSGVYDTVSGAENKYVWRVTAISDYEITSLDEIWIDGQKVALSGDPLTGWVNVTDHLTKENGDPTIRFRVMKGTEDQTLDSELAAAAGPGSFGGELTASDTFAGMAIAIMRWEYSPDDNITSEPSQIVFVGEGAPVHDPRDEDSDPDDPSTWSRTSDARFNPALIAAQAIRGWRRGGEVVVGAHGIVTADIPEASLSDAADICDEAVETDDGTEARYRCGGMIRMDPDNGIRPSLEKVMAAMDGDLVENGGEFTILAGVERVAANHYDLASIGGRILSFDEHGAATNRFNETACSFVDPDSAWEMQDLPAYKPSAHLTADDNRHRVQDIALDFVFSRFQATRIQKAKHERSRLFATATFDLPLIAEETEPGDWFTVTDRQTGQTAAVWEAQTVSRVNPKGRGCRVIIQAQGIAVAPWGWDQDDADAVVVPTLPTYPGGEVPDPAIPVLTVSAAAVSGGGATLPAILAEFSLAESPLETHVEFEYWPTGDTSELRHARCLKSAGQRILAEGVAPGTEYQVRARLIGGPRIGQWCDPEAVTTGTDFIVTDTALFDGETLADILAAIDADITAATDAAEARADSIEAATRDAVQRLQARIATMRAQVISELEIRADEIERLDALIVGNADDIATADAAIANLQTVKADVTALTAVADQLDVLDAQINTPTTGLAAQVVTNESAIAGLDGELDSLASVVTLLTSRVEVVEDEFEAGGRVTIAEATLISQQQTVTNLRESVARDLQRLSARFASSYGRALAEVDVRVSEVAGVVQSVEALELELGETSDPASGSGSIYARIANLLQITGDLESGKADLTALQALELELGEPGDPASASGSIYARYNNLVNVTGDLEANKADASLVLSLETEVDANTAASTIFLDSFTDGAGNALASLDLLAAASGSNPAYVGLRSGDGLAEAVTVADRVTLATLGAGQNEIQAALLAVAGNIHVVNDLFLGATGSLRQLDGSSVLRILLGEDDVGDRGFWLLDENGDPLLTADITNNVYEVSPRMLPDGSIVQTTSKQMVKTTVWANPCSSGACTPSGKSDFNTLSLESADLRHLDGMSHYIQAQCTFTIHANADIYSWLYFRARLRVVDAVTDAQVATLVNWSPGDTSAAQSTGAASGNSVSANRVMPESFSISGDTWFSGSSSYPNGLKVIFEWEADDAVVTACAEGVNRNSGVRDSKLSAQLDVQVVKKPFGA